MKVNTLNGMGKFSWKPKYETWDRLNIDTYKFIFQEAKDKYEDVLSESESITNKSIKLTFAVIAFLGWFAGTVSINYKNIEILIIIIGLLYVYDIWTLIQLLFPKKIVLRGTGPRVMFPEKEIVADFSTITDIEIEKITYYHQLIRYQSRIDKTESLNKDRAFDYKICMILSFVLFVITIILFVVKVFHP